MLFLTPRVIMISREFDLVAGDFNGTAWRHRGKDNLSTFDEAFMVSILLTLGPFHYCGDLDPFLTIGQSFACFSISSVHSPFQGKYLV